MAGPQRIHTSPNFIVNTVKGWNTRLLYTYYGNPYGVVDYYAIIGSYNDNLLDVANSYGTFSVKGQYEFPAKYFSTGKSLRVRGRLLITSQSNSVFNMRASILNSSYGLTSVAAQNNFNDHDFASNGARTDVPVDFEILFISYETDNPYMYMQANGYYQYEYAGYNSSSRNIDPVYVPIWNSTQYWIVDNTLTSTNEIYINFNGSSGIDSIKVYYLTIEELS